MKKSKAGKINEEHLIIQLNRIGNQLMLSNHFVEDIVSKLPKFIVEGTEQHTGIEQNLAMLDILFDHIILQLDQLLEIEPFIQLAEVKTYPSHELTKSLKKIIEPIQIMEKKIRIFRNNLVAHVKDQVFDFKPMQKLDPDYNNTLRQINLLSRLAVCYILGLFANLPDYALAMIEKENLSNDIEADVEFIEWWAKMKEEEKGIIERTNEVLRKNGFQIIKLPNYSTYPIGSSDN